MIFGASFCGLYCCWCSNVFVFLACEGICMDLVPWVWACIISCGHFLRPSANFHSFIHLFMIVFVMCEQVPVPRPRPSWRNWASCRRRRRSWKPSSSSWLPSRLSWRLSARQLTSESSASQSFVLSLSYPSLPPHPWTLQHNLKRVKTWLKKKKEKRSDNYSVENSYEDKHCDITPCTYDVIFLVLCIR